MNFITILKMRIHKLRKKRDLNLCGMCPEKVRGLCCFTSYIYEDSDKKYNIILDRHPCKYLDQKTKLCTVFERRFNLDKVCLEIGKAIKHNALPADCLYVKNNKKYREKLPKVLFSQVKDQLKEILEVKDEKTGKLMGTYGKVEINWRLKNESRW